MLVPFLYIKEGEEGGLRTAARQKLDVVIVVVQIEMKQEIAFNFFYLQHTVIHQTFFTFFRLRWHKT